MALPVDNLALVANTPDYYPNGEERALSNNYTTQPAYIWNPFDVRTGGDVKKYDYASRNPIVKSAIMTLIAGIFWPATLLYPCNDYKRFPEYEEIDNYIIEYLGNTFAGLKYETFNKVVKGLVKNGIVYGYAVAELCFEDDGPNCNLTDIKIKPSYNFTAYANATDELESVLYLPRGWWIDPRDLIYAVWPLVQEGNWFGVSELQSIMHDIEALQLLEERRVKAAELLLVKPIIHHSLDKGRSKAERDAAEQTVNDLESGTVAHFPMMKNQDDEPVKADIIEVLEDRASKDSIVDVSAMILAYEKRINRNFGITDDIGQTTSANGSYARSKTQFDIFLAKVQQGQEWVADVVNRQIIMPLIKYNYGNLPKDYRIPQWKFEETEEAYLIDMMTYYSDGIKAGIIDPNESFIREKLGMPPKTETGESNVDIQTL